MAEFRNKRRVVPAGRSTYDDSYNVYKPVTDDTLQLQVPTQVTASLPTASFLVAAPAGDYRLGALENRLAQQELRSQALVEKAVRTKGDVIEALNFAHGTWKDEQNARSMLQQHIHSITDVVRNLHHDIDTLTREVRSRDVVTMATNGSVKLLEQAHAGALGEMHSRLARSDLAVAQLLSEMRNVHDAMKTANQSQGDLAGRLADRVQALERELGTVNSAVDRSNNDTALKLHVIEGESNKLASFLDARSKAIIDDLRGTVSNLHALNSSEYGKLEGRLSGHVDRNLASRDVRLGKLESTTQGAVNQLMSRCDVFDADVRGLRDSFTRIETQLLALQNRLDMPVAAVAGSTVVASDYDKELRSLERHMNLKFESVESRFGRSYQQLKRECRDGFGALHQTVDNLAKVSDGKLCLLEDQLRKEIGILRKTVVYI